MIDSPSAIALNAVAEQGSCACRELRHEVVDAVRSLRLGDAQTFLTAACAVCGKQKRQPSAAELGYVDRPVVLADADGS